MNKEKRTTVLIESPYAGDTPEKVQQNIEYAQKAIKDCLERKEAPFASHLLYTQALDDNVPSERELGIKAGLVYSQIVDKIVVYIDRGISDWMIKGILYHTSLWKDMEYRSIKYDINKEKEDIKEMWQNIKEWDFILSDNI